MLADAPGAVAVDEDVPAFARAATELLGDRARREAFGQAAARDVARRWSGPAMAKRLLALYAGLAGADPTRDTVP